MTRLALCLLLLATGASAEQVASDITVIRDRERAVTCWVYSGHFYKGGISCIPDSHLQAGSQRQLSPHEQESEPTPATAPARWDEERYSL